MDVKDVEKKKKELEGSILKLIQKFEDEAGCYVDARAEFCTQQGILLRQKVVFIYLFVLVMADTSAKFADLLSPIFTLQVMASPATGSANRG